MRLPNLFFVTGCKLISKGFSLILLYESKLHSALTWGFNTDLTIRLLFLLKICPLSVYTYTYMYKPMIIIFNHRIDEILFIYLNFILFCDSTS